MEMITLRVRRKIHLVCYFRASFVTFHAPRKTGRFHLLVSFFCYDRIIQLHALSCRTKMASAYASVSSFWTLTRRWTQLDTNSERSNSERRNPPAESPRNRVQTRSPIELARVRGARELIPRPQVAGSHRKAETTVSHTQLPPIEIVSSDRARSGSARKSRSIERESVEGVDRMRRSADIIHDRDWIGDKVETVEFLESCAVTWTFARGLKVDRIQSAVPGSQWNGLHDEEKEVQILGRGRSWGAHGGTIRQRRAVREAQAPGWRFVRRSFHQVSALPLNSSLPPSIWIESKQLEVALNRSDSL